VVGQADPELGVALRALADIRKRRKRDSYGWEHAGDPCGGEVQHSRPGTIPEKGEGHEAFGDTGCGRPPGGGRLRRLGRRRRRHDGVAEEVEVEEERSPLELLPVAGDAVEVDRYYTYPGSLTTPGCTEGVRWIVLKDALGVSPRATERLHELIAGFPGYDGYGNNNRPTQPLKDREIESSES
jgi:hypothetical protein